MQHWSPQSFDLEPPTQRPHAVIFDWDNTLVSSWASLAAAVNEAMLATGHAPMTELEVEMLVSSGPDAESSSLSSLPQFSKQSWQAAKQAFAACYAAKPEPTKGAVALLAKLQMFDVPMVCVTMRHVEQLAEELEATGLAPYFCGLVGPGDQRGDDRRPKPHLHAVEAAFSCFPALESSAPVWIVGDTDTDMVFAHNARLHHEGCLPILVRRIAMDPRAVKFCPPAASFRDCSELLDVLVDLEVSKSPHFNEANKRP